jgi:hypothetical protein
VFRPQHRRIAKSPIETDVGNADCPSRIAVDGPGDYPTVISAQSPALARALVDVEMHYSRIYAYVIDIKMRWLAFRIM